VSGRDPVLRVRGLVSRYGDRQIHKGLDLDVFAGEIVGIVGPSGEGKSTLMRLIIGLDRPIAGQIAVLGETLFDSEAAHTAPRSADLEQAWGVMFQDGALFSSLTVRENIALPLREHTNASPPLIREIADMKVQMVGLEPSAANKKPGALSGGMRKRAAVARALALDPRLLFLDEPTAGLDPISAAQFDRLILDLRDALKITVFLVTHDLDTLHAICDRVVVLKGGVVAAEGPIDLVRQSREPWVREYFAGPRGRAALEGRTG